MVNSLNQTFNLNDGRRLGFAELGRKNGNPIFHFNGFPGSRLEITLINNSIIRELNLRLIGVDRPGMGLSEFKKKRRLLDWPDDVIELADHLEIDNFTVEGVSGGVPYALACAFKIPHRLNSCAIIGGFGPNSFKEILGSDTLHFIVKRMSFLYRIMVYFQGRKASNIEKMKIKWSKSFKNLPQADQDVLNDPNMLSLFLKEGAEAFRFGSKGVAYEGLLYSKSWEFSLEDLRKDFKIFLFHGQEDSIVPARFGRSLYNILPNCEFILYPSEGHYSVPINHFGEIIKKIFESG